MDLGTNCVKLTGNPDGSGWTQAYDFFPATPEKQIKRGKIHVLFSASKDNIDIESAKLGRECLQRLQEEYFGNIDKEPLNALRDAVVKIYDEFEKFLLHFEIAAVSVVGNNIYAVCTNGTKVILLRDNYLVRILDSFGEKVISANGYAKDKDFLILSTNGFMSGIKNSELKNALGYGLKDALEVLAPMVSNDGSSGKKGVLVIEFTGKLQKTLEELDTQDASQEVVDEEATQPEYPKINFLERLKGLIPVKRIIVKSRFEEDVAGGSRKKSTLFLGLILLTLLGVSVVFGLKKKQDSEYKSSYESDLIKAVSLYDESQKLIALDPNRARDMFIESRSITESLTSRGIDDSKLTELSANIKNSQGKVLGEYMVNPQLYLDLTLLSDGFKGSDITISDGTIYVLSSESKKVVSIVFESKKSLSFLGSDAVEGSKRISSSLGNVYLLKNDGIYSESGGSLKRVVDADFDDGLLYSFASNLYFLSKSKGSITKYAGTESGFSSGSAWLTAESSDIGDSVSWAFDGSIWVLKGSGKIRRFSLGNDISFTPKGVPFEIADGKSIYTDENLNELYILVPNLKRIVVFDKEGNYQKYYESDVFSDANAILVVDDKVLVMTPEKLWEFGLN